MENVWGVEKAGTGAPGSLTGKGVLQPVVLKWPEATELQILEDQRSPCLVHSYHSGWQVRGV